MFWLHLIYHIIDTDFIISLSLIGGDGHLVIMNIFLRPPYVGGSFGGVSSIALVSSNTII